MQNFKNPMDLIGQMIEPFEQVNDQILVKKLGKTGHFSLVYKYSQREEQKWIILNFRKLNI